MIKEYVLEQNEGIPALHEEKVYFQQEVEYSSPKTIYDLSVRELRLDKKAEEYVYIFCMNTKGGINGISMIAKGTINSSIFSPRDIAVRMLLLGSVSLIVVHNHPSGDPTPSEIDDSTTTRIKKIADLLGINFLDHIIIGNGIYYSYRERMRLYH